MKTIAIVFPHQLFKESPLLHYNSFLLIEEHLYFNQYKFHKQKIAFHRASMKNYESYLKQLGKDVLYIDSHQKNDIRNVIEFIDNDVKEIVSIDPTDNWLEKRLKSTCSKNNITLTLLENPSFLNSKQINERLLNKTAKKYYHSKFYKAQRVRLNILVDKEAQPIGGQWSFDGDNRKKYPAKKTPPKVQFCTSSKIYEEAIEYTENHFSKNYGEINTSNFYPIDFQSAEIWLEQFLEERFSEFGSYEDAIVNNENILNHSLLSPLLNTGLLSIQYVVHRILDFATKNEIPINSTEGLIRQLIGWREFIRGIYEIRGSDERSINYWNFTTKIPNSFYNGTTGIPPIDDCINKVLATGYCHHIERLMVLGNFMLLCEFHPNEVYKWFMELFIDAYDWVMVTNVYGMSQFADGGLMASKPYISSSNYVLKMSNYKKGEWQKTWDGLFWRFMDKQRNTMKKNPRLSMLINNYDKMDSTKKENLSTHAERFLINFSCKEPSLFD
ncbi:cryptochrome/photolyase family protein [Flammeovirga pectinis]|uniref:Cryptochrome/photolyase family protein n=1 Tax=Flammeovirga pectinis TaxID=2494373 RepID=A0A3S9P119_9BACT|nr:cryptochrome/photolyase family protein [Flammeovirga pectinis]AZQ61866.1 cryptochrome/photolyase family protein [Flammeovirga pectinis]